MINKALATFREFGFLAGLAYGIDRILAGIRSPVRLYVYEFMSQPVAEGDIAPPNLTRSFDVRPIQPDDPVLGSMPPPAQVIEQRFAQDSVCLGIFQSEKFVGYQWFSFGQYQEDEVRCIFDPDPQDVAVFDYDFYIFPEYRFGPGFVALWDAGNEHLRQHGKKFSTSRVSRFNTASRKSHAHFGWKRLGSAIFLSGEKFQLMVSSVAPYVHISSSGKNQPILRLPAEKPFR